MQKPMNKDFYHIVHSVFKNPCIVLVGSPEVNNEMGVWKTGKTDFALLLSEILQRDQLVDICATNIDTFGDYPLVTDLETLKYWLHKDKQTKLYIFDEGNVHLPSRRAMSNKSVDIIQVFPEISKARAKLIVIGQKISSLDSELKTTGWVRNKFLKVDLKTVYTVFRGEEYYFHGIPKTAIKFDPYLQAPFTVKPTATPFFDNENLSKLYQFGHGATMKELGYTHPMAFNRDLRKWILQITESYHASHTQAVEDRASKSVMKPLE